MPGRHTIRSNTRRRRRALRIAALLAVIGLFAAVAAFVLVRPQQGSNGNPRAAASTPAHPASAPPPSSAPTSAAPTSAAPTFAAPLAVSTAESDCAPQPLCRIRHIIIIVQENRSFDQYFGTYEPPDPDQKVDGLPRRPNGAFKTCLPDPALGHCVRPFHTTSDLQKGGPHGHAASVIDVNHGHMNGFIKAAANSRHSKGCVLEPALPECSAFVGPKGQPDVMSYHNRHDLPNYYAYADWGVLQDHMFASVDSYSMPAHMFLVSSWSATCKAGPMSCVGDATPNGYRYQWTDMTYLMSQAGISWNYFVGDKTDICSQWPNCRSSDQGAATPDNWNPLPGFTTVRSAHELDHVTGVKAFTDGLKTGDIPQVSWVIPAAHVSEHPGKGSLRPGYHYVSNLVSDIAQSPVWGSTAVFITWDDWGGFYDHVKPPNIDKLGLGIRVPGIVLGPYVQQGVVQHDTLSFDSYNKFIEDVFLDGQRLDPKNDGRPDSRPSVREVNPIFGEEADAFDFTQPPRDPADLISPPKPGKP